MIYKKWFNDTLISGQSKDVLSLTADNNLKNKSIIAEVIYKSLSTKSNPFSLTIKDKPTPPPSKLSTPSNGGNNSKPSTPNTPTNSTIGNNGLVEDLGLDWWVYAAIAGGVVILVAIGITTWLLLKKKNSKKNKKVVKTNKWLELIMVKLKQ